MKSLTTQRLLLRAVTREDTQAVFDNWASDDEVSRYLTWLPHKSTADTEAVMDFWIAEYEKEDCRRYGIQRREDGVLMGMIDVVGYRDGMPVIGYCSGRAFWGKGYMTEALRAVVDELISAGFGRILLEAVVENIGSCRVAEKAGFTHVGSRVTRLSRFKPCEVTLNTYIYFAPDSSEDTHRP